MKIPERSCRAHSGLLGNSVALVGRVGGARVCAGCATVSCVTTIKRNKGVKARTKGALDGKTEGAVVREQTHGGSLVRPV